MDVTRTIRGYLPLEGSLVCIGIRVGVSIGVRRMFVVAQIPAIEDRSQDASLIFLKALASQHGGFPLGLSGAQHQDHSVRITTHDPGVCELQHRRRIDEHQVKFAAHALQEFHQAR